MPLRAYYLTPDGELKTNLTGEECITAFQKKQGLLWVDIVETTEEDGHFLEEGLKFHHIAVENCISPQIHAPKIDDFGNYLFFVVHGINHMTETELVETAELAVFLGSHFVVTNHNHPLYSVESIRASVETDGHHMKQGAAFLAYSLIDALIDNIMPTIDQMSQVAEEIEEVVVHNPQPVILDNIRRLKRSTLRILRVITPQREVINRLSRGEFSLIQAEDQILYRDVYDHMVRVQDVNQTIRDITENALATYMSALANRQNQTMRVLSMVATIFLPLTLLAGIYGMNFEHMPELAWPWGYFVVLGVMGVVIISALWWFWARNWISWGKRQIMEVISFAVDPKKLKGHFKHLSRRPHDPEK